MARYIDADALIRIINAKADMSNMEAKPLFLYVAGMISKLPTADVVPKSEYEAVVSAVDNSTKEFLKLHDDYQEAKREVENLKVLLEMTEKAHEGLKELYRTDTDALVEARRKTEIEVARWIFGDIEKKIKALLTLHLEELNKEYIKDTPLYDRHSGILFALQCMEDFIAELKKKYSEGERK